MEFEAALRNSFKSVSEFWLDVTERARKAREAAEQTPPAYTADAAISDAVAVWAKGMDAMWSMWSYSADLLPTILIVAPTAAMPGKSGEAYTPCTLPTGVSPEVTDLGQLGGSKTILGTDLDVSLADGKLSLKFKAAIASPSLTAGLYQGLAFAQIGPKKKPLGVVLVQLT